MPSSAFTTVLIVVASAEANLVFSKKGFNMRPVLAGFILGIFLYGIEEVAPEISGKFNALIAIGAILYNGAAVTKALTITSYKSAPKKLV